MGVIRVICALFACCRERPDLYSEMESLCIPLLNELLYREEYVMQLESAIDLLRVMSSLCPVPFHAFMSASLILSAAILFPDFFVASIPARLANLGQSYAVEYVNSMVPIFRNFMARNTVEFYRTENIVPIIQMCSFIMRVRMTLLLASVPLTYF